MVAISEWEKRPPEEANLFNPAFLASLIFEFVKAHSKDHPNGTPVTFLPLSLAVVLHKPTRMRLPASTISSMLEWVQKNEDLLIGLGERAERLTPHVKEALRFLFLQDALNLGEGHFVLLGKKKGHFPASFLDETTPELREIVAKTKLLARWLLKSGSEGTILATWGIKP